MYNHVEFDNAKGEAIVFIRRRKPELKKRIANARITVREHTMDFNTDTMRWLGVYLDMRFQFRTHKNLTLERAM